MPLGLDFLRGAFGITLGLWYGYVFLCKPGKRAFNRSLTFVAIFLLIIYVSTAVYNIPPIS